jgi:CheY-like chemotaxis protein
LNNEVVALNRELARKNAEVERLHAQVSRQAHDLTEASRHKDEFLAVLGHELRNPLAPLRNALALLGPDDPDPETVRWARDIMGRQVRLMVRLVDDLLDLSRIMQGKLDLRTERCDLAAVVADAVETARPVIDAKGHALSISLPAGPVSLDADPTRLAQALVNLLNNAAKYADPGGRIDLTAMRDGTEAVVVVRDSGVGIAPELLPHIFDLFTQEERSLSRSQGGLGIGLTLVKSLVGMHGGSVSARSEGLGRGSEFVVRLPAPALTASSSLPQGDRVASGSVCPRRRILVVDDNVDAARALARLLTRLYGQEVRVANDGPEAMMIAEEFRPEVILLDIGLPGMDGNEVARRLRERPEFEKALIVALTGWGQESDVERSRAAGFDHHLVKPANPEAILELLSENGKGEV